LVEGSINARVKEVLNVKFMRWHKQVMAERTTNLTKFGFEATNMGPIVGCNGDPHPTMGYHGLNRRCRQNTYCSGLGISCSIMFHAGVMEKPSTLPLVVEAA
jgi:hypothetical protein